MKSCLQRGFFFFPLLEDVWPLGLNPIILCVGLWISEATGQGAMALAWQPQIQLLSLLLTG